MRFLRPEDLRSVTREEMKLIDSISVETFKIASAALMETAGRSVAEAVLTHLGKVEGSAIAVLAGTGNNGGDGLVAARHLANWKAQVAVYRVGRATAMADPDAAAFLTAVERMGIPVQTIQTAASARRVMSAIRASACVVDAILGTGLSGMAGRVRDPAATLIEEVNAAGCRVVAVDIPSGLDANTGLKIGLAIKAELTVTLGLPKKGLFTCDGPAHTGKILVADLGYPRVLLEEPRGIYLLQKTGRKSDPQEKPHG